MKRPFQAKAPPAITFPQAQQPQEGILSRGARNYLQLIYPSGIEGSIPDCVLIDGTYTAVLLCLDFPYHVRGAWLDKIINAGEGVEISLFHFPQDKARMIRNITQETGFTKHKISQGENQADSDLQHNALSHALYMRKALSEGDDFWYFHLLVRVSAAEKETLLQRLKSVEAVLAGLEIFSARADFRQLEAFLSTLPFCELHPLIQEQTARNALTSGLSSTYPFISYELSDPEGVFMGINEHNESPVILDIFNTRKYSNANMVILGTSGSGKTFTTQLLARRMRLQGVPLMMICPLKGFEYRRLCENMGGNFIHIAPGSKQHINILDIRPTSGENAEESLLAAKIQKLHLFFSLMFPDISHMEKQLLDDRFFKVYAKKGITVDNASLYLDEKQPGHISFKPRLKEMPILGDLYTEIEHDAALHKIAVKLKPYVSGSLSFFNAPTNIDLDNNYIVADISDIRGEAIPLAMFMTLDIFWDRIKRNITQKKCIVLDEAWRLMGAGGNRQTAEFVLEIFKTIRGYGGSAIAATQDISDFMALESGKYGRGVINNAKLKLVLQLEDFEVEALSGVLGLSEEEVTRIKHFQRGHGLLYAGSNHVAISFLAAEDEKRLITTDQAEIRKYRGEGDA